MLISQTFWRRLAEKMKQKHQKEARKCGEEFFFSAKKWNFHFLLNRQPTDPEVESEFDRQFDIGSVDGSQLRIERCQELDMKF